MTDIEKQCAETDKLLESVCAACNNKATRKARIENGYMKGDAEIYDVCSRHYGQITAKQENVFFRQMNKKVSK